MAYGTRPVPTEINSTSTGIIVHHNKQKVVNKRSQGKDGSWLGSLGHAKQLKKSKLVNPICMQIRKTREVKLIRDPTGSSKAPKNHHIQVMH